MTRAFRLGLTGSIGMGKSTTAEMFRHAGVPVWDADAAVARAYAPDGAGTRAIAAIRPAAAGPGGVNREALKAWIDTDPEALSRIEAAVHPAVAADRAAFTARAEAAGAPLVLFDVPLLFETGADREMDATVVVTAPAAVQRARVMARPGMTEALFRQLVARQLPDAEKRARATYVIETTTMDGARRGVRDLIRKLEGENARNRP
jgi:dephospho-CoA kinase